MTPYRYARQTGAPVRPAGSAHTPPVDCRTEFERNNDQTDAAMVQAGYVDPLAEYRIEQQDRPA